MLYASIKPILYAEDTKMFDLIFENGEFSYTEPVMIDQISLYEDKYMITAKEDAETFGCRIENDDDVYIPANLPFSISKSRDPYVVMTVTRNGVSYYPQYIEDETELNCKFTEFGKKLQHYACNHYINISEAYEQIRDIEKYFGVTIIKE